MATVGVGVGGGPGRLGAVWIVRGGISGSMGIMDVGERDGLITTSQAAEWLQISEYTVRDLMKRRELRAVKVGRGWRTRMAWLEEFVSGREY